MTETALIRYTADSAGNARSWRAMPADERRRRAMAAAQQRDVETLWALTDAHLSTYSRAGAALSPYTRRNYKGAVRRLVGAWNVSSLLAPTPDEAAGYIRALEESGLKPQTVHLHLAGVRAFYAALRWARATTADPFRDVHGPRDPIPRYEKRGPYEEEEIARLLAVAGPRDQVLVLLCAHAGLRIAEALALAWADVDIGRRQLTVRSGKGGKMRRVPLSRSPIEALAAWRADPTVGVSYVLPFRNRSYAWARVQDLCARAGVEPRGLHALRHSAGTRLYSQTQNLEMTARLLGHQQLETSRVYIKWSDERLQKTVEEW